MTRKFGFCACATVAAQAMETATAHLTVAEGTDTHAVLDEARVVLQESYGVAHATLQIEPTNHTGCDEVGW